MFGEKMFTGVGYPTPVSIPDETTCLLIQVPASAEWWALMVGVLYTLTLEWNWQQYEGGVDRDVAAAAWQVMFDQAIDLASASNTCSLDVPAPYWDDDDGADADDDMPADDQPWYGRYESETFIDQVSYVVVTAFLATLVTPTAAIAFVTTIRKFRLKFITNPHGGIVNILLDGVVYGVLDLFSAVEGVVFADVASPGTTLIVLHSGEHNPDATPNANGDYEINVIRKQLSEAEVSPPNQRVDPDTNIFQISVDGGTTWNNAECADPRTSDAYMLPPPTPYEGIECDTAARMVAQFKDTLDIFISAGDAAQFATAVMAVFAATVPLIGWFVDLLILAGNALVDIGQSNIEDAFTSTVYDDMRCAFFCFVDHDGRVTQQQLDKAYDNIAAEHPGTVANVIAELRLFYGDVSMVNAGIVRDETGTCDECVCTWCYEWLSAAELLAESFSHSIDDPHSDFWTAAFDAEITLANFSYTWDAVGGGGDSAAAIWKSPAFANRVLLIAPLTGAPNPIEWTGDEAYNGISFGLNVATGSGGLVDVTGLHLEGTGTRPAWTHGHDCS